MTNFNLFEFSDSGWVDYVDDKRRTSDNVFTLRSRAIFWSSKKQTTVALSSSEVEYVTTASSTCQALWLRRLSKDLYQPQKRVTNILCDNRTTIAIIKDPTFHRRIMHIDIQHHFIHDFVAKALLELKCCNTHE